MGKGKVTPVQVAFIVDRYLADNNYSETRSAFRTEASSLIAKSSLQEVGSYLIPPPHRKKKNPNSISA